MERHVQQRRRLLAGSAMAILLIFVLLVPAQVSASHPPGSNNRPPLADFAWTPEHVQAGDRVFAIDLSEDEDGKITQWAWTGPFGGATDQRAPNATIKKPGDYEVTLTVWDDHGEAAHVTKVIHVRSSPPVASFTYRPLHPTTGDTVEFIDHSSDVDGRIQKWIWTTSGGDKSITRSPRHNFPDPGVYTVRLTVIDDDGLQDFQEQTIAVTERLFLTQDIGDQNTPGAPLAAVLVFLLGAVAVARRL